MKTFAREVLAAAYNEHGGDDRIPFEDYDALGVVIPKDFKKCANGTVILSYPFDVPGQSAEYRKVLIITLEKFDRMVGFMAHEYGHFMDLPELYDRSHRQPRLRERADLRADRLKEDDIDDLSEARLHAQEEHDLYLHSAGLGFWGLMAGGARGWQVVDQEVQNEDESTETTFFHFPAPHPMTAWSRLEVGWLDENVIQGNSTVTVKDISEESEAYKIPISGTDQYFLFENRQNTYDADDDNSVGSPYAEHDPKSGLFIWHVDENTGIGNDANEWEERKRVDLECADGLSLGHSTTGAADSETGLDGMDRRHHVPDERFDPQEFGGDNGDAGDLWDGTAGKRKFTPDSNPSSNGYETWTKPTEGFREIFSGEVGFDPELGSGDTLLAGYGKPQNVFSGIYIENIRSNESPAGSMSFDVLFAPMAPQNLEALSGGRLVELMWDPPANSDFAGISSWTVRYRLKPPGSIVERGPRRPEWTDIENLAADTGLYVVRNLENERTYEFEVFATGSDYENPDGTEYSKKRGERARVEGTPDRVMFVGKESIDTKEVILPDPDWDVSLDLYELAAGTNWMLKSSEENGTDHELFQLKGSGGSRDLHFREPPDYEHSRYASADRTHNIVIQATVGGTDYTKNVSVTIENLEEEGSVTLSTEDARAGQPITATLTDPDIVDTESVTWQWKREVWKEVEGGGHSLSYPEDELIDGATSAGATSATYEPTGEDVGFRLKATASYTDGESGSTRREKSSEKTLKTKGPLVSPMDVEFAEKDTQPVPTAVVNDADGNAVTENVTWSLDLDRGTEQQDEAEFTISTGGVLEFKEPPNYEKPTSVVDPLLDLAARNVYSVKVIAEVDGIFVSRIFTITVTDVDEDGTVTLSTTTPVVGHPLGSALDEPDGGVTDLQWQWQRRLSGTKQVGKRLFERGPVRGIPSRGGVYAETGGCRV